MTLYDKLAFVSGKKNTSAWSARIAAELNYAAGVSTAKAHKYDALIEGVADELLASSDRAGGVLTKNACMAAEKALLPIAEDAKSYKVHCVSHAHIDMNWMWGFQETASVTVDTFRTVLDLMKEYPKLTFAQSQASTYRIIEDFAPEMLKEIRQRVKEGRWEVTASTWVETDKNMPNGESLSRHILYTHRYLSGLLGIPVESMNLDFEPDTFGHNITVPEICNKGGVKYYYQCRGNEDEVCAYLWRARSGAEVLVWREPRWYNFTVESNMFSQVAQLCEREGLKCFLSVYGVGDHGGGPTRRDVDRLIEMSKWPIMPEICFSTYHAFFEELEAYRSKLPVMEGELNYVFTGCYSSQSRIKMANRICEDRLYESEMLGAAANVLAHGPRYNKTFSKAWEQVLFNQFHDILPGSGVVETRDYAMGQFQRAMAAIDTNANCAMRYLASAIDTSAIDAEIDDGSVSEGAGVGFRVDIGSHYGLPRSERGVGKKRIFHLFNTTQYDFDGVCDLTVWDWNYDTGRAVIANAEGNPVEFNVLDWGEHYWGHIYKNFAVKAHIPALGYATYTLDMNPITGNPAGFNSADRTDNYSDADIVMENDCVRAVFDHSTMELISLVDKKTGEESVALPTAYFRYIMENTVHGMTAWRVGDYMTVKNLNETSDVHVYDINLWGIRKWIRYNLKFGERSSLSVTVTLNDGCSILDFDVKVDFHEIGNGNATPQLNFFAPVGYQVSNYRYDVPFGTLDRPAIAHDVPANSFAAAIPAEGEEKPALMLISDSKYGFRGNDNALALTLIRASSDPDPYPEYGNHCMRIGLGIVNGVENHKLFAAAAGFVHPVSACSARKGKGELPLCGKLFEIDGNVHLSAVKTAEDFDGLTIRFFDESGNGSKYTFTFSKPISGAFESGLDELNVKEIAFNGNAVSGSVEPYAVKTLLIKF